MKTKTDIQPKKKSCFAKHPVTTVILIIIAISMFSSGNKKDSTNKSTSTPTSIPTIMPSVTPRNISYTVKDTWIRNGSESWSSVIVPTSITRNEIIKISNELHSKFPERYYEFFDDTTELKQYVNWSKAGDNSDNLYYPEDWYLKHGLGIINKMMTKNGLVWQFFTQQDRFQPEADLDIPTKTQPTPTVKIVKKVLPTVKTEDKPAPVSSEAVSQKNAVRSAKSYISYTAFSHDGLVAQLEYEKFSHADAVYGADNSGANWNEQAAKSAKQYMEYSAFSRGSLIDQLKYDKYTQEQAEYGADAVGL